MVMGARFVRMAVIMRMSMIVVMRMPVGMQRMVVRHDGSLARQP